MSRRNALDRAERRAESLLGRVIDWFQASLVRTLIVAVVLLILTGGLTLLVQQYLERKALLKHWAEADGYLRQSSFAPASESYADLRDTLLKKTTADDPAHQLAEVMQRLTETSRNLDRSLDRPEPATLGLLMKLEELRRELQPASATADANADSSGGGSDSAKMEETGRAPRLSDDGQLIELSFPRDERWNEVMRWLATRGQRLAAGLEQQTPPLSDSLKLLDEVIGLLERSRVSVDELRRIADRVHRRQDCYEAQLQFETAAREAEQTLTETAQQTARGLWRDMQQKFGSLADAALWTTHEERLRERLLAAVKSSSTAAVPPQPGRHTTDDGPPLLPTEAFGEFIPVVSNGSRTPSSQRVFVRHEDRTCALDAGTGEVRAICRTGFDARWLPQQISSGADQRIVLAWENAGAESVSVTGMDFTPVWTWHLAPGAALAGPPAVVRDRVFVWLQSGELWQLSLATGRPSGYLKLPGGAGGPLVLRDDQQGAALIDRQLGIYVVRFEETPVCEAVVMPAPGSNTLDARLVWMPPFLLIFENQLTDRCQLVVLREAEGRFFEVQREELNGRLWQSPAVFGTSLLIVSDLGYEAVQRLQLQAQPKTLFTVFQQSGSARDWPSQPQVLSHPKAPFVAALGNKVVRYAVNALESQVERQREVQWEHAFPHPQTVPMLELQATSQGLVATGLNPDEAPLHVHALDFETGELQWSARVGNHVVDVFASPDGTATVYRTASGDVFRRSKSDGDRLRRLARVNVNSTVDFVPSRYALSWVQTQPPELIMASLEGTLQASLPLSTPAAAPVAVLDGPVRPVADNVAPDEAARELPGPWVALLDTDRRIHLKAPGQTVTTQFAQLSRELPGDGWWRPVWLDASRVLLSHPDGELALFAVRRTGAIVFPSEVRSLRLTAGLAAPPVVIQGQLWIAGRDAHLRVFDLLTLELRQDILLPDAPAGAPAQAEASTSRLAIGLANGHVALINTGSFRIDHDVDVSAFPVPHVLMDPDGQRVRAIDAHGTLMEIQPDGSVTGRRPLSGPVSATPVRQLDAWLIPTSAGEVVRLP